MTKIPTVMADDDGDDGDNGGEGDNCESGAENDCGDEDGRCGPSMVPRY